MSTRDIIQPILRVTLICGWHRCLGYYSCIYAAGLAPDLQILPGGDQAGNSRRVDWWDDTDEMHQDVIMFAEVDFSLSIL